MVTDSGADSFALTFRMDQRAVRVITPITAAQGEHLCRRINAPQIAFNGKAMWDTGSTGCCIDRQFAEEHGLEQHGHIMLRGAQGVHQTETYLLDIRIDERFILQNVEAAAVNTGGAFNMIIGMNIITLGRFVLDLVDGKTMMTFSLPAGVVK